MMRKHPMISAFLVVILFCAAILGVIGFFSWMTDTGGTHIVSGDKIAVIQVNGPIADSKAVVGELIRHRERADIKAIVLRVDSPGGAVAPSQEIYREVKKTAREKTVVASMGNLAASGGYYVLCGADLILANPGTITGSIGVLFQFNNFRELFDKIGLESVVVKSGKYKDIGSPTREMVPEERALIEGVLENVHAQFLKCVIQERELGYDAVETISDGRFFSGEQAKDLGLVDSLGTLQDAIEVAAWMGGIEGKPQVVYPEKKRRKILDLVFDTMFDSLFSAMERFVRGSL